MKERIQNFLNRIYPELVFKGYRLIIKEEENLSSLNNRGIPVVVYFNHQAGDDPAIVSSLVQYSSKEGRKLLMPVSDEYTSLTGKLPWYAIGVLGGRYLLGWKMMEIVQAYRLRDERVETGNLLTMREKNASRLGLQFFKEVKRELKKEEKPVIIISPEGHRSSQGLLPAERGIGILAELIGKNNGLILPLGLIYHGGKRGLNYNPFNPLSVEIVVGRPLSYDEVIGVGQELYSRYNLPFSKKPEEIAHSLMGHLTTLLPENLHGCYHPDEIRLTLAGQRRLGINNEGEVIVMEKYGEIM